MGFSAGVAVLLALGLALPAISKPPTLQPSNPITLQQPLPTDKGLYSAGQIAYDGWNYLYSVKGELIGRQKGDNEWSGLADLHASRQQKPIAEWQAKFVLLSRVDILDRGRDGVLRQRRSGFFDPDLEAIQHSIALFAAMVDGYTQGKLKLVPEIQTEDEAIRLTAPSQNLFGPDFIKWYFEPRVNGGAYEADDKVFRGPYQSIFFIHSGLTDSEPASAIYGMPVSGVSFYFDYDPNHSGELARRMFNEWIGHVVYLANRHGYALGPYSPPARPDFESEPVRLRLPQGLITDSMWPSLVNMLDTKDFAAHAPGAEAKKWSEVRDEPWTKARLLKENELTSVAGFDTEAPCLVQQGQKATFVCEPEYADFVASHLTGAADPICEGFIQSSAGPKIVLSAPAGTTLAQPKLAPAVAVPSTLQPFNTLTVPSGFTKVQLIDDPEKGKVRQVSQDWAARTGGVRLFGSDDGSAIDTSRFRFVDVEIKPGTADFALSFFDRAGKSLSSIQFWRSWPSPAEHSNGVNPLNLDPKGGWQHAVVDLTQFGPNLSAIYLTAGDAQYWETPIKPVPSIEIGSAHLTDNATPTPSAPAVVADASSSDPEARALFAARVKPDSPRSDIDAVASLIGDPEDVVVLNAVAAFTRIKDKAVEERLGAKVKNLDERIAEQAANALEFQGTDTARGPLLQAIQLGPFEHNRMVAALALAKEKDPNLGGFFSDMKSARYWQTKLAAVEALGAMPGSKAPVIMLAYMLDNNPHILMRIAQLADTSQELSAKRMEWYSVNDPYDGVRANCDIALIRSSLPGYPEEGLKGLKDDSMWVRLIVLDYLREHPLDFAKAAVQQALTDSNREVRAAAAQTLAAYPTHVGTYSLLSR